MKKLSLTIVVPVYNEQECIRKCLDAIAAQTERPDGVIIVDNNSTDNTVGIARTYDFVTVITEKQQGIVYARNAGFNQVGSDIIGRIDADTILDKDWVARVRRTFAERPDVDAVTGDCHFYDFPLPHLTKGLHHFFYYRMQRPFLGATPLWGSNMAIRRRTWHQVRPLCSYDKNEDIDLTIHLAALGKKIKRDKGMHAGVSLRRGNIEPAELIEYLKPWPKTYWHNGLHGSALVIYLILGGLIVFLLPTIILVNITQFLRSQFAGWVPAEDESR